MAHSISVVTTHRSLKNVQKSVAVTLTGSYATPGEVITATAMGLYVIQGASASGGMGGQITGQIPVVELSGTPYVNSGGGGGGWPQLTLRFLGDTGSLGPLTEMADGAYGTPLTSLPIVLLVWGRAN
jgi:hypothetical protein